MILADRVWGVLLLFFGLAVAAIARSFPKIPGRAHGSAPMPTLVGIGLVLCGLLLIAADLRRPRRPPLLALAPEARERAQLIDAALVPLAVLAFILFAEPLGFVPVATLIVSGLIWRYRRRGPGVALAAGLVTTLLVDWMFRHLLLVPLPLGPLAPWLR